MLHGSPIQAFGRPSPGLLTTLAMALLIGGCSTVTPPRPVALADLPPNFKTSHLAPGKGAWLDGALLPTARSEVPMTQPLVLPLPAEAQPRGHWWRVFKDPVLDRLIERAEAANTDISIAAARLTQARALVGAAEARGLPQVQAVASASRQGGPLVNAAGSSGGLFTAAIGVAYEPDLFGRVAAQRDLAGLEAGAREALLQSTRLLVQADVTQTYLALRARDAEAALLRQGLASLRETLQLTELQVRVGSRPATALPKLRAELAEAHAEVLGVTSRRDELEHALATLVGQAAPGFTLEAGDGRTVLSQLPDIPAGIPAEVLARRPDVSAAQQAWLAAQLRRGQARTAWFPNVALTASGGQASGDLASLLKSSLRAWALTAVLVAPLLDGGQRAAAIQQADAEAEAAEATARAQMLVALREVQDHLSGLQSLAAQATWLAEAEALNTQAAVDTTQRWRKGNLSRYEVLTAERASLRSQRLSLLTAAARQRSVVSLVRALGGGWAPGATQLAAGS